jgi:hypothetical protein
VQPKVPASQPGTPGYQEVPVVPPSAENAQLQPGYVQVAAPAPPAAPVKSGMWVTVLVVILAVMFVGGLLILGSMIYVGHRVVQKAHQLSAEAEKSALGAPENATTFTDECSLLSKQDVSRALGVQIEAANPIPNGCEYLAKGTAADMTARHMAALQAANRADSQIQNAMQKFAGGIFTEEESKMHEAGQDRNGNTPVLAFSVDQSGAAALMKVSAGVMGTLGPGQKRLQGIGDEALDESGAMMLVRKGDKLIRITYTSCPCATEAIKPLAEKLADAI